MEENTGVWMSILEYASFKSISISTIRRYIKAERVKTKKEGGKRLEVLMRAHISKKNSMI